MIDGFTVRVNDPSTIRNLLDHSKLEFKREVNLRTGEARPVQFALYKKLRFEYREKQKGNHILIRGNLPFTVPD